MTTEDVVNYINDNDLTLELLDNTEPAMEGLYQLTSPTGFSTFEMRMTEDQAKYAAVLLCRLTQEHNVDFGSAERLAMAYVSTYKVMQDDIKQEVTEEATKQEATEEVWPRSVIIGRHGSLFCGPTPTTPAQKKAMREYCLREEATKQEATEEERQAMLAALDNTINTMKEGLA
jgi:hypothetical protein